MPNSQIANAKLPNSKCQTPKYQLFQAKSFCFVAKQKSLIINDLQHSGHGGRAVNPWYSTVYNKTQFNRFFSCVRLAYALIYTHDT